MSVSKVKVTASNNSEMYQLDQKYRPQSIDEIILPKDFRRAFKNYIKKGQLPHLLLHSTQPGTGKTTTARAIVNDMGLDPREDYLFLKGDKVNVSFIDNELHDFCTNASPTGNRRVVIIDEYDRPTLGEAQKKMRATVDEFSSSVTFIITANKPEDIHSALRDRMHAYNFGAVKDEDAKTMKKECYNRLMKICELEGITVEDDLLIKFLVEKHFPYFRKCLTDLSKYAFANDFKFDKGVLKEVVKLEKSSLDVIVALKETNINTKKLYAIAKVESYNASNFINNLYVDISKHIIEECQIDLVKVIGEMNKTFKMAINPDIHLFYLLIQLATTMRWKD